MWIVIDDGKGEGVRSLSVLLTKATRDEKLSVKMKLSSKPPGGISLPETPAGSTLVQLQCLSPLGCWRPVYYVPRYLVE